MRSEQEMMEVIKRIALEDERVRAVYMNGSRTNPNAPKDIFQDYDIVYVVTDTAPFLENNDWINLFGDILLMQEPDRNDFVREHSTADGNNSFCRKQIENYGYLMLFADGNRIDLHIQTVSFMLAQYQEDMLTVPLLDKDGCLPSIPPPSDEDYHVKKPTKLQFASCANNFWWCLQNVGKGIWRDELPYAKHMFEQVVRMDLDQMVSWWIGMHHDYRFSVGKMGKYFKDYLPEPYWKLYSHTYSDAEYDHFWQAIFSACELFSAVAHEVSDTHGYIYLQDEEAGMLRYLERVRKLQKDAKHIF